MVKFIKTLTLFSALVAASQINANEGAYVGLSFGNIASCIEAKVNLLDFSNTHDIAAINSSAGAIVGYNNFISDSPIMVGLELSAHNNPMTHSKFDNTLSPNRLCSTTVKTNNTLAGNVKVGVVINELVFYVKLGIVKTNWNMRITDNSPTPITIKSERKMNSYGSDVGFGIDFSLNKNWSMGIEHKINDHSNLRLPVLDGHIEFNPTTHHSTLRLLYSF